MSKYGILDVDFQKNYERNYRRILPRCRNSKFQKQRAIFLNFVVSGEG